MRLELVDDALDDVVFDGHAVGRYVIAADAVEIPPPDDVNGKAELAGDRFDDRFDRKHALRSAIAAKGRIGDSVGFARQAAKTHVGKEVTIVGMAQRACQYRRGVIGDAAAVGGQREIERLDASLAVESDIVPDQEWMALAGCAHVVVAREPQLHRPARLDGEYGGDAGDDGGLALLAAERSSHAPHLDGNGVERQAEQMRDAMLDFGRMLGRTPDLHVAVFARHRERDLPFEVEVILTAATHFAGQAVRRAGERRIDLATRHHLRRRDEALACHRLLDAQDGRKRLIDNLDQSSGRACLIERGRGDGRYRLALVFDDPGGQCRFVAADRGDVVLAGNVGGGDRRHNAGGRQRRRQVDAANTGMGMGAQHQRCFERARLGRDIVEVACGTGDVSDRAVVTYRGMHPAARSCERFVHNASTRTGTFDEVSNWKRRNRPAAARRR